MGRRGFFRVRTKAEKRQRSAKEHRGDVVLGLAKRKEKEWALRTLIQKHGGLCAICRNQVSLKENDPREATIDHIIPISKGGSDHITNLQLACRECNGNKGSSSPEAQSSTRA